MKSLILVFSVVFLLTIQSISVACGGSKSNSTVEKEALGHDLILYANMGSIQGVSSLLETGKCDVNYENEHGDTALMVAANRNDYDMMEVLIEYGADLDAGDGRKYLVRCATFHGNQAMMRLLGIGVSKESEGSISQS